MQTTCPCCCFDDILRGKAVPGPLCDGCASHYNVNERIICAALSMKGIRILGVNHAACFNAVPISVRKEYLKDARQGFVTSHDRFVDRGEAAIIAVHSGQLKGALINYAAGLTSEDLTSSPRTPRQTTEISRAEAAQKIRAAIDEQRKRLEPWAATQYLVDDTWDGFYTRLRNYEIEERLHYIFGGEWIINEPCPFNGMYCRHGNKKVEEQR